MPAASEGWSGRRGSNPRPTAWKAVTLPLSYSRLRSLSWGASPRQTPLRALSLAAPPARRSGGQARSLRSNHPAVDWRKSFDSALRASLRTFASAENGPSMNEARRAESNGGEGRIRTSEAARATDLQSAAFDRFATSPILRPRPRRVENARARRHGMLHLRDPRYGGQGRAPPCLPVKLSGFTLFDFPCGPPGRNPLSCSA